MSDNLRDRIAAALLRDMREQGGTYDDWEDKAGKLWVTLDGDFNITDLADAVIRELVLREESGNDFAYGWKCPKCNRGMEADHGPVCNVTPPVNLHRYVTEWECSRRVWFLSTD